MRSSFLVLVLSLLSSCATLFEKEQTERIPPKISESSKVDEMVEGALEFGAETLLSVKKQMKKRHLEAETQTFITSEIKKNYQTWKPNFLMNALNLYQFTSPKNTVEIFSLLVKSEPVYIRQMGWHLAATFPSKQMAQAIETVLTESIMENEIRDLFLPKMAEAVGANNLVSSYSLIRQGLFQTDHVAFAQTMILLDPQRAATDFLDYLAKAPAEELRQLNVASVNLYTCTEILAHLEQTEIPITHHHFEHLFYYSISRNGALSEMGRKVLNNYIPKNSVHMAFLLAKLPTWAQIAYIEGSKSKLTPVLTLFFREVKKVSARREVIEEIENTIR